MANPQQDGKQTEMSGVVLGLCNPLLDISAQVPGSLLNKYDLKPANAILADEKHMPLYNELVSSFPVEYIAGGASQNTIRVCQWMLGVPGATSYIGCVGKDKFGRKLREMANADGVRTLYLEDEHTPTGTAAILVTDKERSIVANIGAANCYKYDHLLTPEVEEWWSKAKFFYSSGFFLTVSPQSYLHLGRHAAQTNKVFMTNLAATFIPMFYSGPLWEGFPYVDFLFGNETESKAVAEHQGWQIPEDPIEYNKVIARRLADAPKVNMKRRRVVVFTCGPRPVVVAIQDDPEVYVFPTPPLDPALIVDSNGAGDSFVGGFLSQLVQDKPVAECVRAGNYAAQIILQRSGCSIPDTPPNFH